ncbi:MAG: radical SAM family heme chaperone HemW [Bacteroidota bacterium]
MAGIYIHIPFCRHGCDYCDFYYSLQLSRLHDVIEAIVMELRLRRNYLKNKQVKTIYLGGGTPSIIKQAQLEKIVNTIREHYNLKVEEFTMEVNPDDISQEYLKGLLDVGVNRLSIGIQSFDKGVLEILNRKHDTVHALHSIELAYNSGFKNISVDLIYGVPGLDAGKWQSTLEKIKYYYPAHVSAYHLTYEKGTRMWYKLQKERIMEISEDESIEQYEFMINFLKDNGYDHYEISSFARDNLYSKHNMSYWQRVPYIGIGPSAHSYNGISRQWNQKGIQSYVKSIMEKKPMIEEEFLSETDLYNEYVLTSLRTKWGIDIREVEKINAKIRDFFTTNLNRFIHSNDVISEDGIHFRLTTKGLLKSNFIYKSLFLHKG